MKKKNALWMLLDLIFLVLFNVVFFVIGGTEHPLSTWISYGFIHFSYLMLLVTPKLIRASSSSSVFGFTLYSVSSAYFMIEFIVGLVFILVKPESYKVCLVVQVIIAGIYAILLITNLIANEQTAENIEHHENELKYVRDASSLLKAISGIVKDKKLQKQVEHAYDIIHASPVKSTASAREYELTVVDLIEVLSDDIKREDFSKAFITVEKIINNANKRNQMVRAGN